MKEQMNGYFQNIQLYKVTYFLKKICEVFLRNLSLNNLLSMFH